MGIGVGSPWAAAMLGPWKSRHSAGGMFSRTARQFLGKTEGIFSAHLPVNPACDGHVSTAWNTALSQDPGRMLIRIDANVFRAVCLRFLRVPNFAQIKLKT